MPLAREVAAELRRLADSLDTNPEVEIAKPVLSFYHWSKDAKELFLAEARALPRPLKKKYEGDEFSVCHESEALYVYAKIPRNAVCTLVTPAVPAQYECDPILSQEELEEVGK